jgi:hypothetical protein
VRKTEKNFATGSSKIAGYRRILSVQNQNFNLMIWWQLSHYRFIRHSLALMRSLWGIHQVVKIERVPESVYSLVNFPTCCDLNCWHHAT